VDDVREIYGNALAHALALEIDGDILASLGGVNMKLYVIECRGLLQERYGIVPYPFSEDNYWG